MYLLYFYINCVRVIFSKDKEEIKNINTLKLNINIKYYIKIQLKLIKNEN